MMKKFISIVLSMIMAISVMTMASIPAMAAVSPQTTTSSKVINGQVNGSTSAEVTYTPDSNDPNKVTFSYNGTGDFDHWEFPGLTEGVDYEIISEDGNPITIKILNPDADIVANAIVKGESTTKKKPGKKDNGSTSPKTGAMTAAGIAVAGAGFAILAALKKDEDAE